MVNNMDDIPDSGRWVHGGGKLPPKKKEPKKDIWCYKCGDTKPIKEFYVSSGICKKCGSKRTRKRGKKK